MHVNYYGISEPPTLESCNFMIRGSFDINLDVLSNFSPRAIDCATFYDQTNISHKLAAVLRQYPPLSWLFRGTASYENGYYKTTTSGRVNAFLRIHGVYDRIRAYTGCIRKVGVQGFLQNKKLSKSVHGARRTIDLNFRKLHFSWFFLISL